MSKIIQHIILFPFVTILFFACGNNTKDDEGDLNPNTQLESQSDTAGSDSVRNTSLKKFDDPNANDTAKVYNFLDRMFEASMKDDYATVGPMIAYVGLDSTRTMDSYNINNPDELDNVRTTMEALNLWLTDKSIYYFDDTWIQEVDGFKFIIQEVVFGYETYFFIVFDRGDQLLLSNISKQKPEFPPV